MFHKGKHNREKQLRFSIRKVSFGAASVAVAALFMFLGNGAVSAAEQGVSSTNGETQAPQPKDQNVQNGTYEGNTVAISPAATVETNTQPSTVENSSSPESAPQKVETLDKKELTDLIKEIDGKLSQGTYASKTDNSVNQLKTALDEAKSVLNKAKTQAELSQAQAKLVVATTKLQTKPEEKKEAPAVDTTNGKSTVGKKATNTEKAADTNSIANSGSRDERNGKALDKNNPFRTDTAPSTSTSTDPLAVNETPKSVANQYFDENVEKPTGNEKLKLQPAANLTGWKFENPNQNKIIIANGSTTYYGNQMFPSNHRYGIVLGGFTGIGSSTKFDNIGSIYQDIDVVPNSELVLRMRGATFGTQRGSSTYKAEIFDVNNLTTPLGTINDVHARPAEYSGIVNIPEGVTKVRIKLTDTNSNQKAIGDGRDPYVDIDGVKVYTGAMVANFRASSGSYVVPTVGQTNYTTASESRNQATVETTITVNLENKGGESSQNSIYRVQLPEGATLKENSAQNATATVSNGVLSLNAGAIAAGTTKTISYTLVLPATAPLSKDLQGTVSYQTTNLSILNPTIPRKSGSRALENQNITITMYKADLRAEAAKAATLNQSDYTPEAWAAYQAEIAKAQEILNEETNNVAIANRKNQADINTQTLLLQKAQAKLEIDKAKKEKLAAIEGTPNATKEEKEAAKQAAQEAATNADKAIDKAADNAGVTTAQTEGTAAVEAVSPTVAVKEAAKADLAEAAKAEKAEIAADKSLTEAERKEKEQAVDTKKAEEEAKITASENADKVAEAKTAGVTAIKGVHTPGNLDTVKEAAKADLAEAAKAEKAEIAADKSLTEAERKEKETAVDTKKAEEEAKITAAENADKVAEAKTAGVTAIKGVHTPGTSSSDSEGNVIVPPTVEVPAYTDPVGTSSTDGEGNLITPPTVEAPAYTDSVGTSSTDGEGNLITPPTVEVPAYTDPVGTSSTDGVGNLITPPTVEVPAYTEPVGTSSTDGEGNLITPPTVEAPAYTDSVGTSSTDGEGNLITPPTVEVPAYTDSVGTSSTDGEGNLIIPPTVEVPAYTDSVGTSSTDGEGNVIIPPTAEVPAYIGSVNGISEETPAKPAYDRSANEMPDRTSISETTINKDRQLPNTGTADSTVTMVAAAASAVLGLSLAGRRRKEDEEV